jgi:hypothetical protein
MSKTLANEEVAATEEVVAVVKRDKKLTKNVDGTVVTITAIGGEAGEMTFDTSVLSADVQSKLVPFGVSHKLGDAAAGRTGKDAEEAIQKVWEGLLAGEWTVRQAAAPKVSLSKIKDALAGMSPEDAEKARALMASMGITI